MGEREGKRETRRVGKRGNEKGIGKEKGEITIGRERERTVGERERWEKGEGWRKKIEREGERKRGMFYVNKNKCMFLFLITRTCFRNICVFLKRGQVIFISIFLGMCTHSFL
jgi:hypothetical protein